MLEKYEVAIKDAEKAQLETLPVQWNFFIQTVSEADKNLVEYKAKFKAELLNCTRGVREQSVQPVSHLSPIFPSYSC